MLQENVEKWTIDTIMNLGKHTAVYGQMLIIHKNFVSLDSVTIHA